MSDTLVKLLAAALGLLGLAMAAGFVALAFLTFLSLSVPNYRLIAATLAIGLYALACVTTAIALFGKPSPFWHASGGVLGAIAVVLYGLRLSGWDFKI
ncbi:hypothetical protein [Qipengyuania soli]|uniref:Uncharacterized protein n=1 Tax=Qipengyuania soli TaxID=2782568 RepID=A0A7S8F6F4_9SPHN|nr:hypothetical protein [Qipengyuania soli]QPD00018.1 hypothetical protein IRL76_05650 [Qipengyuania soli]